MSNIYIITDTSGSMAELGKNHLLEYLLRTIADIFRQEKYSDIELFFFAWGNEIIQIEEPFEVECIGKTNIEALIAMLKEMDPGSCILLLSDGHFEYRQIKEQITERCLNVIGIIVGADASASVMNEVSIQKKALKADSITAAIALLCSFIDKEEY